MNHKMVLSTTGHIVLTEALLMLFPLFISLIYKETSSIGFITAIAIAVAIGLLLSICFRTKNRVIYAKEGFVTVALAWLSLSLIGAIPFIVSGEINNFIDAFFETVSGFTTTGASILTNVENLSKGLLFWRSFTHWIGGMGVLVFIMAIIPDVSDRSIHIIRAEMPGPIVGKLVPRAKDTAKILYLIYIVLTAIEILMLIIGGMPLFDSMVHSFGTAGTGGFGLKSDSIAGYSPYLQWVITVFMLLFGINFNLYYLLLLRKIKSILRSTELWVYLSIVVSSIIIISVNVYNLYGNLAETLRHSSFQVSSIITTTGYSTTDFNLWPELSKGILLILMFIGGCAGSTAGGLKISRFVILLKMIRREIKHMLHPRSVNSINFEGKTIEKQTITSAGVYFTVYIVCFFTVFLLICNEPFGFETNFSAAVACFNNVGPGFGAVGPSASFADYSGFSKIILSFAMLLGRLEIFPLIIALYPATWSKNK